LFLPARFASSALDPAVRVLLSRSRTTVRSPLLDLFLSARFASSALDPAVRVLLSRSPHRLGVQVLLTVFRWLEFSDFIFYFLHCVWFIVGESQYYS
jgi:hypothetical protein